uniref:Uncharacterized protein n=1 Tax=Physcomitrium patens TaxID=3218 RepID=A0A7I3ZEP1_PHYPA
MNDSDVLPFLHVELVVGYQAHEVKIFKSAQSESSSLWYITAIWIQIWCHTLRIVLRSAGRVRHYDEAATTITLHLQNK